jgi:lipopolysaccharide/colanic/teichoic acid biosynthesis glycosyltransferase
MDMAFAVFAVLVAALPMAAIAMLVRCIDGKPVLFRQERIGLGGRTFVLVKFRTMTARCRPGPTITAAGDSRITRLGAILRRTKLDELPQLFNVLFGDMSFVGPRPDVPGYWDALSGDKRTLLRLRPGITGPATLVFRDEEQLLAEAKNPKFVNDSVIFPEKLDLNRRYLDELSLAADLKWMAYTLLPPTLLKRRLRIEGWTRRILERDRPRGRPISD